MVKKKKFLKVLTWIGITLLAIILLGVSLLGWDGFWTEVGNFFKPIGTFFEETGEAIYDFVVARLEPLGEIYEWARNPFAS